MNEKEKDKNNTERFVPMIADKIFEYGPSLNPVINYVLEQEKIMKELDELCNKHKIKLKLLAPLLLGGEGEETTLFPRDIGRRNQVYKILNESKLPRFSRIVAHNFGVVKFDTCIKVENGYYFKKGAVIRANRTNETMLILSIEGDTLEVERTYGNLPDFMEGDYGLRDGDEIMIMGLTAAKRR